MSLLAAASAGFAAALAMLAGCGGDQPLPPDEALAECIRSGSVAHWSASRYSSEFTCALPDGPAARLFRRGKEPMIVTEDEAIKKRCTPSMVIFVLQKEALNTWQAGGAEAHVQCIGSKCMQWIWYDYTKDGKRTWGADQFKQGRAEPVNGPGQPAQAPRGYCGLTGAQRDK